RHRRLAGQGLEQSDRRLGERARHLAADGERTDDLLLASEWDGDQRSPPVAAEFLDVEVRRLAVEILGLRGFTGDGRAPDERLAHPDPYGREGLRELCAGTEAGPQHELGRRWLVLENGTAVRSRQLDRARHDRVEHLVEVEAQADCLADLT